MIKVDLSNYINVFQGGFAGYWNENDAYMTAPPGEPVPYYENGERMGIEVQAGGGTVGHNPFAEGAAVPNTLPTNWFGVGTTMGVNVTVSSIVPDAGGMTSIQLQIAGTATGTGRVGAIAFGPIMTPASLPAASAGQNWYGELHARWATKGNPTPVISLGFQVYDVYNNWLTTPAWTVIDPQPTGNVLARNSRFTIRSGAFPTNTARCCLVLQFEGTSGQVFDSKLNIAWPCYANRNYAGYVLGKPSTPTTGWTGTGIPGPTGLTFELTRMIEWFNQDEGTFFFWFKVDPLPGGIAGPNRGLFQLNNYTTNERFFVNISNTNTPGVFLTAAVAGTTTQTTLASTIPSNTWHKAAVTYGLQDGVPRIRGVVNTQGVKTISPARLPRMLYGVIGANITTFKTAPNERLNGVLRQMDYYPRQFSDAELAALTA